MILHFFTSLGVWGALPPSDRGSGVLGGWRARCAPDGSGGGVDVPLRVVAGSDGGEVPAAAEVSAGDRLQATAIDVLERLVEATYTRDRRWHLAAANLGIEKLRFLCRLAKDLGHLDERRYEPAAFSRRDETGRLIGGWRKADEAAKG